MTSAGNPSSPGGSVSRSVVVCPACAKRFPKGVTFCPDDGTRLAPGASTDAAEKPKTPALNNRVMGSYMLQEVIAEGGMGIVFAAEHIRLGRKVALKTLRSEFMGNKKAITRFFREARAVNQIKHENIIEITDFVEDPEGENYYVMELLTGQTLKKLIVDGGPLPIPRALGILLQICNAMAAVHRAGIVHRDLKTENIFLLNRGGNPDFVKLLDFGVAKLLRALDDEPVQKTVEGTILGTPEYMSPEQASGKAVDFRTDIYSLGVVLYEMVTGRRPIAGKSFTEIVFNQLSQTPIRPTRLEGLCISLPLHLEDIVMQCLEKDPELRPQSMEEIESRLREIGRAGSVACETSSTEIEPFKRRTRRVAFWTAGALGIAALATGFAFLIRNDARSEEEPPAGLPLAALAERLAAAPAALETSAVVRPETIKLRFLSTPPGAAVFRQGEAAPLGVTPCVLPFDRAEQPTAFVLKLKGHRPALRQVSLREPGVINVPLIPLGKGVPRPRRGKADLSPGSPDSSPVELGGTIDPFDE